MTLNLNLNLELDCHALRRRAWLTREGWYYLAVLAFIVGGAVLRSVNLLVVLAGMMIAPLLFNWRLVMASLTGLIVRRKLPEQILRRRAADGGIEVENSRRWMSSWLLTVEDWIEREHGSRRSGDRGQESEDRISGGWDWRLAGDALAAACCFGWDATRARRVIAHVPARAGASAPIASRCIAAGAIASGRCAFRPAFRSAWSRARSRCPADAELIVAPRLGRLSPEWAQLLEAELVGDQRRHPQRGVAEGDYYGLRPWQSGDSLRWVHWRTTAKLGRPIVRQFERRRSRDVALVLDPWLPGHHYQERDEGLVELAISLAATAVADLTSRGHSHLTIAIAGAQPQCWTGPASPLFCQELLAQLAELQPDFRWPLGGGPGATRGGGPIGARDRHHQPPLAAAAGNALSPLNSPATPKISAGSTSPASNSPRSFRWSAP